MRRDVLPLNFAARLGAFGFDAGTPSEPHHESCFSMGRSLKLAKCQSHSLPFGKKLDGATTTLDELLALQ